MNVTMANPERDARLTRWLRIAVWGGAAVAWLAPLAARLLAEGSAEKEKIRKAFRTIVCRRPSEKEVQVLSRYYQSELKSLNASEAEKRLAVGESPLPQQADKIRLAALMQVVTTIYNLEETLTKS